MAIVFIWNLRENNVTVVDLGRHTKVCRNVV